MKRYLTIFIVLLFIVIKVNAKNYELGDVITYKDIKFYVVSDNEDYLTLLKATPLTVDEVNKYGEGYINKDISIYDLDFKNKAFDNYQLGYGGVSLEIVNYENISSDNYDYYDKSNIKLIVENWSKDKLNLSDLKEININSSINKYKARLLTKEELKNQFHYTNLYHFNDIGSMNITDVPSDNTPKWITRFSYWLMSAMETSSYREMYYVHNFIGYKKNSNFGSNHMITVMVRPVIHLNKTANFTKEKIKETGNIKNINDTEFKVGDIVKYNDMDFYVLKNADKNDTKLTLIKKEPLTYEELKFLNVEDSKLNISTHGGTLNFNIEDLNDGKVSHPGYIFYCDSSKNESCSTEYNTSYAKEVLDLWADESLNKEDLTKDDLGYKIRLLTIDELKENLGYIGSGVNDKRQMPITGADYYEATDETPVLLKDCWTMSTMLDSNEDIYIINDSSNVYSSNIYNKYSLCPVITINKKIGNKSSDIENKSNKLNIPDTLLNTPVFIVIAGIILIVVAIVIISLIIRKNNLR